MRPIRIECLLNACMKEHKLSTTQIFDKDCNKLQTHYELFNIKQKSVWK